MALAVLATISELSINQRNWNRHWIFMEYSDTEEAIADQVRDTEEPSQPMVSKLEIQKKLANQ
jgi:hypothetical protein